jgi:hypothetical protein
VFYDRGFVVSLVQVWLGLTAMTGRHGLLTPFFCPAWMGDRRQVSCVQSTKFTVILFLFGKVKTPPTLCIKTMHFFKKITQ